MIEILESKKYLCCFRFSNASWSEIEKEINKYIDNNYMKNRAKFDINGALFIDGIKRGLTKQGDIYCIHKLKGQL